MTDKPSSALRRVIATLDSVFGASGQQNDQLFAALAVSADRVVAMHVREGYVLLALMEEQIELARDELRSIPEIGAEDWDSAYARLSNTICLSRAVQSVAEARNSVGLETMGLLRVLSKITPATERLLSPGELAELTLGIEHFAGAVNGLPRDSALTIVLREQLSQILRARRGYPIAGATLLRRSVYELDGALINEVGRDLAVDSTNHAPEERHAITRAQAISSMTKKFLKWTGLIGAGVGGAQKVIETVAKDAEWIETGKEPGTEELQ